MFLFQIQEAHSHHQRQGSTRLYISIDEFRQDIQADLGICHSLNDADRQRKAEGDEDGQQESPPSQICGPGEDGDESEPKHLFPVSQIHSKAQCILDLQGQIGTCTTRSAPPCIFSSTSCVCRASPSCCSGTVSRWSFHDTAMCTQPMS